MSSNTWHASRVRFIRHCTNCMQGALLLASLVAAALLLRPLRPWSPPPIAVPAIVSEASTAARENTDYSVVWSRNLRQPLVDPPAAPVVLPQESPPPFQLAGTVIERGRSFAILALSDNRTLLKETGASVEGFEIHAIERGLVRLRRNERTYELRVPWYAKLIATSGE